MSVIGDAIIELQTLSRALTSVTIKSAPDNIIANADPTPFSIAYIRDAAGTIQMRGSLKMIVHINVDFYFNITNPKLTFANINAVAREYLLKLAANVTLSSKVTTIIYSDEEHPTAENVGQNAYGGIDLYLLRFVVPLKLMETY